MKPTSETGKALEYVESHSKDKLLKKAGPCITVSRESGAGSGIVDEKLKEILAIHQNEEYGEWAVFDKNLIEKVIADHNLPDQLTRLMTHENYNSINNILAEMLGLQPSARTLMHQTAVTILQLAYTGNVIIVGRGSNLITAKLKNTFHVRLVAPLEDRIKRIQAFYNFGRKEAQEFIKEEDVGRKEFIRKNFLKDIDDPLLYHMILNTHLMTHEQAAHVIANAVMAKFPEAFLQEKSALVMF
jgi:cytidylate kinase